MIGLSERDTESGIHVFRVHYTADPMKRDPRVLDELAEGMLGGRTGSAWLREMEINWQIGSGLGVYTDDFVRDWHVAKGSLEWIPGLPLYRGWDTGPAHVSPACVIAQLDSLGRLAVLKEIPTWTGRGPIKQAFVDEFCELITLLCNQEYPSAEWKDVCDPAAWTKQSVVSEAKSAVDIMNRYGIFPQRGAVTFTARKDAMYNRLSRVIGGVPAILIDPSCRLLIEGFAGKYQYEELGDTGRYNTRSVDKNAWSHPMDGLSYIVSHLYQPAATKTNLERDADDWRDRRKRRSGDSVTGY